MKTTYEVVVIQDVLRPEDQIDATLEKIEGVIKANGGEVTQREVWGKKRLAYPIERRRDGHYTLILFETETDGPLLEELNRHLRITEEIVRYLITKAVIGKSRGNPPSEEARGDWRAASFRASQGRGDRRGDRGDRGPRPDRSAPAPTPPAESASASTATATADAPAETPANPES